MLRSWHNLRANPIRKDWRKLGLFLVTSTEPALLIQGAQSPFNIGTVLNLKPFPIAALRQLNVSNGLPLQETELAVYPTNFACPSSVVQTADGEHQGMTDVMSPWSGAVAQ